MTNATGVIEAEARLRAKNQITLPDAIARALGAEQDDTFVFVTDPADPTVTHLRRLPRSYAGSLTGVFGTSEEVLEYIKEEHDSWGE